MSAGVVRLELELDILAGRSSGGAGPPGSHWALILILVKCYWKDSVAWIVSRILVLVMSAGFHNGQQYSSLQRTMDL